MTKKVGEIMTRDPVVLGHERTALEAASRMRERDVGSVLVMRDDEFCGIVTDRDLVVRCLAEGADPKKTKLGDICSADDVATVSPDAAIDEAIALMRERAVRRIPVLDRKRPVGVVSIGDLAVASDRDRESALGAISAAPPNR